LESLKTENDLELKNLLAIIRQEKADELNIAKETLLEDLKRCGELEKQKELEEAKRLITEECSIEYKQKKNDELKALAEKI
jgi:hypothetical protein